MDLSYSRLKSVIEAKGYSFFDNGFYNVNIFGIRSNYAVVDDFNDFFGVAYRDDFNKTNLQIYKATTKPGLYWLKNKLGNINGTAILIPGQYRGCWTLGYHKNYQALRQNGLGKFKVWRDSDSDGEFDIDGQIFDDVTWLNAHTTSFNKEEDKVGAYSAGCQVIQDSLDFNIFMSIIIKSAATFGTTFSYTLLEQSDFS